jgi:hypothetical protein
MQPSSFFTEGTLPMQIHNHPYVSLLGILSLIIAPTVGTLGLVQAAGEAAVISLTQTGCQFVEPEGQDHHFKTTSGEDCKAINKQNGEERLAASKTLELRPGTYIFRVTNKNVPYELGFYLRGSGLGRLTQPRVSGGGLLPGVTQDYEITLTEGAYVYSCPLNPTPDYRLVVKP